MTLDELHDARERLLEEKQDNLIEVDDIKRQIAYAKARVISHGEYSDPHWFASAQAALKFKTRRDQEIQAELSVISRDLKRLGASSRVEVTDRMFIDAARLMLPRETFQRIMDFVVEAEARRSNSEAA
jgi:cell division septum initiation protein DivIVA